MNSRAARVDEPDYRSSAAQCEIHDLHDLVREGLRQRASENREILGEDVDHAAVDLAVPRYHANTVILLGLEPEVSGAVNDETIELHERALVQKKLQTLPRR